jgi:hypothetical protein
MHPLAIKAKGETDRGEGREARKIEGRKKREQKQRERGA